MILIENATHKRLYSMGIKRPEHINESKYKDVTFTLKHPLTNEILDEFHFNEYEFNKLDYSERLKYEKLDKTSIFNEKKYIKDLKKFNESEDKYYQSFAKERLNVMEGLNITSNLEKVVDGIVSLKSHCFIDDILKYETDILTELRHI